PPSSAERTMTFPSGARPSVGHSALVETRAARSRVMRLFPMPGSPTRSVSLPKGIRPGWRYFTDSGSTSESRCHRSFAAVDVMFCVVLILKISSHQELHELEHSTLQRPVGGKKGPWRDGPRVPVIVGDVLGGHVLEDEPAVVSRPLNAHGLVAEGLEIRAQL